MNVLLVRPPDPLAEASVLSHTKPMNLAYLAAYLRAHGFDVSIIDYEAQQYSDAAFVGLLKEKSPSVIGVSCVTPTITSGAKLCGLAKQFNNAIVTVVGGAHANGLPAQTLEEFPAFDYVVYGEGEVTFTELCKGIENGVPPHIIDGLAYRKDGAMHLSPPRKLIEDIDSLPFPARDLIDTHPTVGHSTRGVSNSMRTIEIYTSRGCPFSCSFCAIQATFGNSVRLRKLSCVEEEIRQATRDYPFDHLIIADDTFSLSRQRAWELCDIFARNNIRSWSCDTRVSGITPELLKHMAASGCKKVAFGVESGSPRILDLIGKKITVEQVKQAVHWAKEAGLKEVEGNFIIGCDPSETLQDIALTRELINSLPWSFVSVSIIVPYPGTPVYCQMKDKGLISPDASWEDYVMFGRLPKWRTEHFSPDELLRLQRKLTREFYLSPGFIMRRLLSIRSFDDARYWVSAGTSYAKWYFSGRL